MSTRSLPFDEEARNSLLRNSLMSSGAPSDEMSKGVALVFGASGEQGRAVITGLLDSGYSPVYGATRDVSSASAVEVSNEGCVLIEVDLADSQTVEKALRETGATAIFLVTTTDFPPNSKTYKEAEEKEYAAIVSFFDTVVKVYEDDKAPRHIIFSTLDNVEEISNETDTGGQADDPFIKPLEDGSVCAHYTGKARGGDYGLRLLNDKPDLALTLVTLPFLHSNFLGFAIPLPNEAKTQWTIEAAFGDAEIDMFSASDLATVIPAVLDDRHLYEGYNIRLTAEKIGLDEVASLFSDLFGKDVIYNPLTAEEMAELPIPSAPCMAQMCRFLADRRSNHDMEVTEAVMFPKKPQLFKDWLLTHSDHPSFEEVGLSADPAPILSVTVFGATSPEGTSVVKGLLADKRKQYTIRATTRDVTQDKALAVKALDPDRVMLVQADYDDVDSCAAAVEGMDGVFLVTDFYDSDGIDPEVEEQHAKNIVDACEASKSVRHVVFSTLESVEEMNKRMNLGLPALKDDGNGRKSSSILPRFDAKARAAAYARTKRLSCTYVLMPVYSEKFFELLAPELQTDDDTGKEKLVMHVPRAEAEADDPRVMCMSVDELGPAVANIFDSYQVFAGHEIGLVTDFVTVSEVAEMITETFSEETDGKGNVVTKKIEKKDITVDAWVEKRDTVAKDLGQMFSYYSKTDAVKKRRSVAKTLQLVPDAKSMKEWLEENKDNVEFRQMLGLR